LRARIDGFLERYPSDGLAPMAHVLRALVALRQGELGTAERELRGPSPEPGTTRDLWTVACAEIARLHGNPSEALELLRPLVGKSVDPIGVAEFEEELTRSSLAAKREFEAISYMDAWIRASSAEDHDSVVGKVTALVADLPTEVLEAALEAMRSRRASYGYGTEIERILTERLVDVATRSGNSALARALLEARSGHALLSRDAATALGELAASRRGLATVEGRTVGLVLPAETVALRDESADVLVGLMWALGLPKGAKGVESSSPSSRQEAQSWVTGLPDAGLQGDPRWRTQGLRLITRGDSAGTEATEVSLGELAGAGASIIIAGVDGSTSARALRWANATGVVVIAIVAPEEQTEPGDFGFVLGERRSAVADALAQAVPSFASTPIIPVIDASELPIFPAEGVHRYNLTFGSPVSCDAVSPRAGEPRFPLAEWREKRVTGWVASGSADCARELVDELSTAGTRGTVALTFEASSWPAHSKSLRVVTVAAGSMPPRGTPVDDDMRRFLSRFGGLSWMSALARDAGVMAMQALQGLPIDAVSDSRATADRRTRARNLLAAVHASLWTTEATGWADNHAMPRSLSVREVDVSKETMAR
jgi:hypothetical protein